MATTQVKGTHDITYNLISAIYHSLQGAETYQTYEGDAKEIGDQEAASFFNEAQESNRRLAERAKALLGSRLGKEA
jgi:rubrerythrin